MGNSRPRNSRGTQSMNNFEYLFNLLLKISLFLLFHLPCARTGSAKGAVRQRGGQAGLALKTHKYCEKFPE